MQKVKSFLKKDKFDIKSEYIFFGKNDFSQKKKKKPLKSVVFL